MSVSYLGKVKPTVAQTPSILCFMEHGPHSQGYLLVLHTSSSQVSTTKFLPKAGKK